MKEYTVYVTPAALKEIKDLPGHVRQRVRRAVEGLRNDPRPAKSKELDVKGLDIEVRRLRLDRWRLLYALTEGDEPEELIDVLAVRKRPPYDYGDLADLLKNYPATED